MRYRGKYSYRKSEPVISIDGVVAEGLQATPYNGGELENMREEIQKLQNLCRLLVNFLPQDKQDHIADHFGYKAVVE